MLTIFIDWWYLSSSKSKYRPYLWIWNYDLIYGYEIM